MNLTQLDGDFFVGFDKRGFTGGIKAYSHFSARSSLQVEILYTQKGANIPHGTVLLSTSKNDRKIDLNYVEIPILFKYMLQPELYKAYVEFGPVVSRLYNYKITENDPDTINDTVYSEVADDFNSLDLNLMGGVGFNYPKFDISFRYTFAVSKLYENPNEVRTNIFTNQPEEIEFLRNYHLGVALSFKIF